MTNLRRTTRILIVTMMVAALALVLPAAPPTHAAGLRNCVGVNGPGAGNAACYELVWANGVQYTMTFSNQQFTGATPADRVDNFYVLAPQTDTLQSRLPFPHDHVVGSVPPQNRGEYRVVYHGYFVLCSAEGIASGGCMPTMTSIEGLGTIPFATIVNEQMLTSSAAIESAASSGLVTLIDSGGVLVGTINPGQ